MLNPGMIVVCLDNENAEQLLQKFETYVVTEVLYRGFLVKIEGITETLAANRFRPVSSLPPEKEQSYASY